MSDITLVILAAGMGSRYGGLKQIDKFGLNGEAIIDFSIYDAIQAGFTKLVLIIRKEHQEIFEEVLVSKIRPFIEVEYAFQDLDDVPDWFVRDPERVKPWGTTHALLSAKDKVTTPFAIINADDFYGRESYRVIADFLRNDVSAKQAAMIGFKLENTLTDHGTVTRGVCVSESGKLESIVETEGIRRAGSQIVDEVGEVIPEGTAVSMNFWGFSTTIFEQLQQYFISFLKEDVDKNPLKAEALLPNDIGKLVSADELEVEVLTTPERWIGVTYQEDKPRVMDYFKAVQEKGIYPKNLWQQ